MYSLPSVLRFRANLPEVSASAMSRSMRLGFRMRSASCASPLLRLKRLLKSSFSVLMVRAFSSFSSLSRGQMVSHVGNSRSRRHSAH